MELDLKEGNPETKSQTENTYVHDFSFPRSDSEEDGLSNDRNGESLRKVKSRINLIFE